tara:strand:- start:23384 stop:23959 length:576 start_codon:yes stop_codon:yes gene_type:complete
MDTKEILSYWFEKGDKFNSKKWFIESYKYDTEIKEKFEKMLLFYEMKKGFKHLKNKDEFIAFIILLDQFPRQIYRNTEKAFSFDKKIMEFTDYGFEYYLEELTNMEIIFAFMPYIHSENKIYREKSKKILEKIQEKMGEDSEIFKKILKNYENHEEVFDKFGRFPKRNDSLNRKTNEEEMMYLHMRKNKYC